MQLVAKMFPGKASIMQVMKTARTFWDKHPTQYIAIHCAYGGLLTCCVPMQTAKSCRAPSSCIFWSLQTFPKALDKRQVFLSRLLQCAGFNRTGFVVCAYLVLVCGLSVQEALANFAVARPPGVKHEKFIVEVNTSTCHLEPSRQSSQE